MSPLRSCPRFYPVLLPVAATLWLCLLATSASAQSCPDDTPPDCTVNEQFAAGRVDFTSLTGTYTLGGTEIVRAWEEPMFQDPFDVSGTLTAELLEGPTANYLDVACDGTITGQGKERISGTIDRTPMGAGAFCPGGEPVAGSPTIDGTGNSSWDVVIERTYSITGMVTGTGELELDLSIDEASFEYLSSSRFSEHSDCEWLEWTAALSGIDLARATPDIERIRLTDTSYDPTDGANWHPEVELRDTKTWLENTVDLLQIKAGYRYNPNEGYFASPGLLTQAEFDALEDYEETEPNAFFFFDPVTVMLDSSLVGNAKAPVITDMQLDEPSRFLTDVMIDTTVTVTVDWRNSDSPQQIEFTYGSTTETLSSGGDSTSWTFDAGETGTTIKAKATAGSGDSLEWEIATPKVTVPGWAGASTDWSGSSGVQYEATLDWPVSLETSETVDSLSLVTGLWGVTGSISSEFNAKASSSGSATAGDLMTEASLQLAGNEYSFDLTGTNNTTLGCDDLVTEGTANAQFPELTWKKTLNPLTAIPGIESAVCSLGSMLCNLITGVGLKGEVTAGLSGSGMFMGDGAELEWSDGSLNGSLSATISFQAIPPPLSSVVSLGFEGGGTGCLGFQFSPMFELQTLGGDIHVGLNASAFGLRINPTHDWQFGDACAGRAGESSFETHSQERRHGGPGWVPADGQLAMAAKATEGAAVWSELPSSGSRPLGDLQLRRWDIETQAWGAIFPLTSGSADMAPSAGYDTDGNLLVVYQRSTAAVPTDSSQFAAFSNALELHYLLLDSSSSVIVSGQLTSNSIGDLGPTLRRDASGVLHLFWQRVTDAEVGGTGAKPVSIHAATWNPLTTSFGATDTVASGLDYTLGWHPAAASDAEMLVALLQDTDDDYSTQGDREIFQITKASGTWLAPIQVTTNAVLDDAPLAAFDGDDPILLWRQAGEVLELNGDLFGTPTVAFGTGSPATDDGISAAFAHGLAIASPAGLSVVWPESVRLAQSVADSSGWNTPEAAFASATTDRSEAVHALFGVGHDAIVGYSKRAFLPGHGGLEDLLTPHVATLRISSGSIFANGFETGDTTGWSASTP